MTSLPDFPTLLEDFSLLDHWEERYRYILDLGKRLPPLREDERVEANRVHGCVSTVWLVVEEEKGEGGSGPFLKIRAQSDALMVQGLLALVVGVMDGKSTREIREMDFFETFRPLGLEEHLSRQRSNGLYSVVKKIQSLCS